VSGQPNETPGEAPTGSRPEQTGSARQDAVSGTLATALGAAVLLHVRSFPELPEGQPGPALFPGIVGALFVLFGLTLVVRAVLARRHAAATSEQPPAPRVGPATTTQGRVNALAVLGSVVAYLLLVEALGFVVTMGPLLFLLMWRLGARPLVALVAAAVTTGAIVLIFQELLLVPLPTGLLG
jgi:putative tricarboxylic transport membrane protein